MLGPTTWSIVKEAQSRDIPFIRLNEDSHIQLGYGAHQKQIQASITSHTSAIAVETADEKTRVKTYLKRSGIPVPDGQSGFNLEEAIAVFSGLDAAVVVKPDVGNHGNGSTINVTDLDQLKKAFQAAQAYYPDVIVEEYVHGDDFRFLVIDGKFVAAARREPAHIMGDGKSSIQDLIHQVNSDPLRGFGHEKVLTQIEIDEMTERILSLKGLSTGFRPEGSGEDLFKDHRQSEPGGHRHRCYR